MSLTVLTRSLLTVKSFWTTSLDEHGYNLGGVPFLETRAHWFLV